jgi:hypothetical protein
LEKKKFKGEKAVVCMVEVVKEGRVEIGFEVDGGRPLSKLISLQF